MKVFTVGMDEKPPLKEPTTPSDSVTVVPPPMITVEKKNRGSYKGYLMCMLTVFFILLFAVILSELAYNRARDENYLRLRWAELKQRMAMGMGWGCDGCMNNMMNSQALPIVQTIYPSNNIEAAPIVATSVETSTSQSTTPIIETAKPIDITPKDPSQSSTDPRFEFLRQILSKIREQAEKAGIEGTMQVSLIRVDPMEENQDSSFADGFGEIQRPLMTSPFAFSPLRRIFGPWPAEDYGNDIEESRQLPDFLPSRRANVISPPMVALPVIGSPMMGPPIPSPVLPQVMLMSNPLANRVDRVLPVIREDRLMQNIPQVPVIPPQPALPDVSAQQWHGPFMMGPPQIQQQPQAPPVNNQWQNGVQPNMQSDFDNGPWMMGPNRWQASLQRNNEWNIQKSNLFDNLDERMSQAVPFVPQDGAPWWNQENQWANSNIQQPQQQPQPAAVFMRHPFNMAPMQPQQPVIPQQQQLSPPQQPQQQAMFFFPQQTFGNENQVPVPVQFPTPEQTVEQQPQQQQQQLPPQVPQVPVTPQALPVIQAQSIMPALMIEQPQVVPQIQNAWPRTDTIFTPSGEFPQVPIRPVDDGANIEATAAQEASKVSPPVAIDTIPFIQPQQHDKVDLQESKFPGEPINEAARGEQMTMVNPIFFQVDEPRHIDNDGQATNE